MIELTDLKYIKYKHVHLIRNKQLFSNELLILKQNCITFIYKFELRVCT